MGKDLAKIKINNEGRELTVLKCVGVSGAWRLSCKL